MGVESQVTVADLVAECISTAAEKQPEPQPEPEIVVKEQDTRKHVSTLLLSDSMMRHVETENNTVKEILPDARSSGSRNSNKHSSTMK